MSKQTSEMSKQTSKQMNNTHIDSEIAAYMRELALRKARENYLDYCKFVIPNFKVGKHIKLITEKVDLFLENELITDNFLTANVMIISMPPQHGKLASHDTPVLTVEGWKTHGELKVGDYIFGRHGEPIRVLNTFNDGYADYEVEITDGEKIKTHGNHEWIVYDRSKRKERKISTKEMYDTKYFSGNRCRYQLDENRMVNFEEKELIVNPYAFGLWLGDGSTTKGCITHHKDDIQSINKMDYKISSQQVHPLTGVYTTYFKGLRKDLVEMGFCKGQSKYIPDEYKFNSKENRLELLAGLIDSDGYVYQKNGRIIFSNTNKRLIDDVEEVVRSLGFRATVCKFKPKTSSSGIEGKKVVYQLGFNPDIDIPTALPRKKTTKINPAKRKRGIKSIRKIEKTPGRCIQVEKGVYLIGKKLVPTHNSLTLTETLPSYYLGKYERRRVIEVSYNEDFAGKFGRKNKEKIEEFGHEVFDIKLSKTTKSNTDFELADKKGSMQSRGILSGITGNPADLIIIDDPIKNRQEANSETSRERIWEEFLNSVNTRLSADGKIIVIMTRWHEDDLSGRIISSGNFNTYEMNIPLEAEENDILGRKPGDALFPEIGKDNKWLANFKRAYINDASGGGLRAWTALFQGQPTIQSGDLLKRDWWQTYDIAPKCPVNIITVDATFKEAATSDYVVIQAWGKKDNDYYLLDMIRQKMGFVDTIKAINTFRARNPAASGLYIEDKANGSGIIDVLRRTLAGVIPYEPRGSKESRVNMVSPLIESGNVYIPQFAQWKEEFLKECSDFPNGKHDDMVDAMSMGLDILRIKNASTREMTEEEKLRREEYRKMIQTMTGGKIPRGFFKF